MKKYLLSLMALAVCTPLCAQWKPAGNQIRTLWAEKVTPENVWAEYPRPLMERSEWKNLNGLWDYAVVPVGKIPAVNDGKILVPFAIESSLSGVRKRLGKENELWYTREFTVPSDWAGKRVLLHFGAVDWKTDVWVNDIQIGGHTGGYTPFFFDITSALQAKGTNTLKVKVWDPTDEGYQPRGKQVKNPGGIMYTPVSGIWQTVWLEPVAQSYISRVKTTPDIDKSLLTVEVFAEGTAEGDRIEVSIWDGEKQVAQGKALKGVPVRIAMGENFKLWSPDSPFLYDMKVKLVRNGKSVDEVKSYTAMRKFSTGRDADGIMRLMLNNKPIFHLGPLDQGWWPDGLYTAASDEALEYDVIKTKDFGYNMIRKHVKVEPARWYTHCDRHGIIVWQDMPSGDGGPSWQMKQYFDGAEWSRTPESEANFRREWQEIIDLLYSHPSIGVWVPFNEAWGQFKSCEIAEWTKAYDPTRSVNPASGGNHYPCGDILDLHSYPHPEIYLYDAKRVTVLGEYGGLGLAIEGHLWAPDHNWGYVQFKTSEELTDAYIKYTTMLKDMIPRGFSAGVYTQTSDVEMEVNGLMTYDRKKVKMDEARIRALNLELIRSLDQK